MQIQTGSSQSPSAGGRIAQPGESVYFCRDCGEYIFFPKGQDPTRCLTPGCQRPTGFGRFADKPARRPAASGR